jgi:hypothetical protein
MGWIDLRCASKTGLKTGASLLLSATYAAAAAAVTGASTGLLPTFAFSSISSPSLARCWLFQHYNMPLLRRRANLSPSLSSATLTAGAMCATAAHSSCFQRLLLN